MKPKSHFSKRAQRLTKKERTRALLLDAAGEVFGRRGPLASVNEIAEEAGVAIGTFYNHFANREELLQQLSRAIADVATREMEALMPAAEDGAERLARGFASFLSIVTREPDWGWAYVASENAYSPPWDKRPAYELLENEVRAGIASGRFNVELTDFLLYFIEAALRVALRAQLETNGAANASVEVVELILAALGVEPLDARRISLSAHQIVDSLLPLQV